MSKVKRLILTWKKSLHGRKIPIAEFIFDGVDKYYFKYIIDEEAFENLKDEGFRLYAPFNDLRKEYNSSSLNVFKTRLPDRRRGDFKKIIGFWDIQDETISDFDLIRITGAKLPTDMYEFIYDFSNEIPPFDLITNVAGVYYNKDQSKIEEIKQGDELILKPEKENPYDPFAIQVLTKELFIVGYLPKIQAEAMHKFIDTYHISIYVTKVFKKIDETGIQIRIYVTLPNDA